jgi:hypothetical protein
MRLPAIAAMAEAQAVWTKVRRFMVDGFALCYRS